MLISFAETKSETKYTGKLIQQKKSPYYNKNILSYNVKLVKAILNN